MEPIALKNIVDATGGQFFGDAELLDTHITEISTNSREIGDKSLFVPLVGDKFDAHDFIESAYDNGCVISLSHKKLDRDNYILVEDTLKAFRDIAEYYRGLFDVKVIALTGSVGKTTAKEMIAAVLSQKYNVLKNMGNYNNEIGVPKTLFNLTPDHDVAVIEMGMNSLGEISRLSKVARPDAAVIMNIGDAHIGMLGSRDNIFDAKCEIFDYMKQGGDVFLYGDDDMLVSLNESDLNPIFFGEGSFNHVSVHKILKSDIEGTEYIADYMGESITLKTNVPGKHMIPSVQCALAIAKSMGLTDEQIKQGVLSYVPAKMRNDIIKTDTITIINDAYNSCEESILAGLDILAFAAGRKVAILGDILEVGDQGRSVHYSVGQNSAQKNVDVFICCGDNSRHTFEALKDAGKKDIYYYEDKDKMHNELGEIIKQGDTIYVKASRGCAFEKTVDYLKAL